MYTLLTTASSKNQRVYLEIIIHRRYHFLLTRLWSKCYCCCVRVLRTIDGRPSQEQRAWTSQLNLNSDQNMFHFALNVGALSLMTSLMAVPHSKTIFNLATTLDQKQQLLHDCVCLLAIVQQLRGICHLYYTYAIRKYIPLSKPNDTLQKNIAWSLGAGWFDARTRRVIKLSKQAVCRM